MDAITETREARSCLCNRLSIQIESDEVSVTAAVVKERLRMAGGTDGPIEDHAPRSRIEAAQYFIDQNGRMPERIRHSSVWHIVRVKGTVVWCRSAKALSDSQLS